MGIEHIAYGLSMWKHCLCSVCELFCDLNISYVPIYSFVEDCNLPRVAEYLKTFDSEFYAAFVDMLIFDCLIYNEDRHFGNFGLLVDNHANKPAAFAPLFDNGLSLFNYGMPDDFDHPDEYAKTRMSAYGVSFEEIAQTFITVKQKEKLRKMIGFSFAHHANYNLPMKRLRSIEKHLQKRAGMLLAMPENS